MFSFFKSFVLYALAAVSASFAVLTGGYFGNHIQTAQSIPPAVSSSAPCVSPITYTLGTFDTQFGLTKGQFLDDINQAAEIWDKPFDKTFFVPASSTDPSADTAGDLKINLIYDYRQQATDAMNAVGSSIDDETTVYSALKAKYDSLNAAYMQEKAALTTVESNFQTEQNNYNQTVDYWNSRGGAPSAEYATLTGEKNTLESQAAAITQDENALNGTVATINDTASTINKYVVLLNSEATQYNSIASTTGEEFDEGEYVEDATGHHIDIFQYSTQTKLIRVLAHELGHSLGLGHSYTNPQAIMYPLNQGTNLSLAPEDISALDKVCEIK